MTQIGMRIYLSSFYQITPGNAIYSHSSSDIEQTTFDTVARHLIMVDSRAAMLISARVFSEITDLVFAQSRVAHAGG